jgi:anti-anti-sigma regulatory factor
MDHELVLRIGKNSSPLEIQEQLLSLPGGGYHEVVLDLSEVKGLDSSILGSILLLRQALNEEGTRLRLHGCPEAVSSELQRLRIEGLLGG